MNVPKDYEATRRRETLHNYQDWLAKEQPLDYPKEKDADTGSMFPAVRILVATVIFAAILVAVVRQVAG